jgi:hypothetical protein
MKQSKLQYKKKKSKRVEGPTTKQKRKRKLPNRLHPATRPTTKRKTRPEIPKNGKPPSPESGVCTARG